MEETVCAKARGGRGKSVPEASVAGTQCAEQMGYIMWLGTEQSPQGLVDHAGEPVKGLRGGAVRVAVHSWKNTEGAGWAQGWLV